MPGTQGLKCPDGNRWVINPTDRGFICLGGNHTLNQFGDPTGSYASELATEQAFLKLKSKNEQHRRIIPENTMKASTRLWKQQAAEAEQEEVQKKACEIAETTAGVRTVAENLNTRGPTVGAKKLTEKSRFLPRMWVEEEDQESLVDKEQVRKDKE